MKVIFLDVDGVLNSDEFFENNTDDSYIDIKAVKLIKKAIEETGANVVVSSSFRYNQAFKEIEEILLRNGILFEKTPFINNERGREIKQWLSEESEIEDYVILDDEIFEDFNEGLLSHLIKMDNNNTRGFGKGLQLKDIEKIIKRFGRIKSIEDDER